MAHVGNAIILSCTIGAEHYGLANHLWSLAIVVRGCDYSWETNRLVWSNGEGTIDRGHEPMNALGNCPC
jgi:hypothetical protein